MTTTDTITLDEIADYYSRQYHYLRYPARVNGQAGAFCVWSRDVARPNPSHVTWDPETAVLVCAEMQTPAWHAERAERAARPNVQVGDRVTLGSVTIEVPFDATRYISHVPCKEIA